MADYKKRKNIKRITKRQSSIKSMSEDIAMKSSRKRNAYVSSENTSKPPLKVIKGNKRKIRYSVFITLAVSVVLVCIYFIILAFHPIGVTEYFSSIYKIIGSSQETESEFRGENIVDCKRFSDYYYLLTETDVKCFNNNGKLISGISHGYAKPVISTADTRYLVFGQGEKSVRFFNYEKEVSSTHFDEQILCADISDNGTWAVATYADGYDSVVRVYNKNGKVLFEWYSADGIVNSIMLTSNSNKILISTFNADKGSFESKLGLFNFKSADSEKSFEFQDELLLGVYQLSDNMLCALSENKLNFIDLKQGTSRSEVTDYSNRLIEQYGGKFVSVGCLSANTEKNYVTVFDKKGNKISSFTTEFPVNFITYNKNSLFVVSNSEVFKLDIDGNVVRSLKIPFDTKVIVPISEKYIIAINNSGTTKISLDQ